MVGVEKEAINNKKKLDQDYKGNVKLIYINTANKRRKKKEEKSKNRHMEGGSRRIGTQNQHIKKVSMEGIVRVARNKFPTEGRSVEYTTKRQLRFGFKRVRRIDVDVLNRRRKKKGKEKLASEDDDGNICKSRERQIANRKNRRKVGRVYLDTPNTRKIDISSRRRQRRFGINYWKSLCRHSKQKMAEDSSN